MAIRGFEADCPDSKVVMVASERLSNWHEHTAMMYMESTFLADETISAVLTATNHFAIGAVKAADKRLSAGAAQGLFVSSFGYKAELAPYLAEDRVFATADELLTRPNQGVWRTMASTMEQASHLGWMTTADVQAAIPSMMGVTLQSSSLLIPSDAEGHIISTMLSSAYNPEVRPLPAPLEDDAAAGLLALQPGDAREGGKGSLILAPTTVYVGIDQLVVQQIDVPANTFQATFWLDMSWYDARLTWTRGQYSGDIQVSKARVWTPDLYVLIHLSETVERDGGETLVTMRNDGTVFWSRKITGEFDCKMHIEPYPFDIHRCYINITTVAPSTKLDLHGYGEARIPAPVGFTIIAQPEGFLPIERLCAASVCGIERVCGSDERVCGVSKGISVRSRPRFEQKQLSYTFRITREPSYVITSYVMMAWLLVILSMLQFWIPEESGNMDRAGLAITTVLATVVLMTEGVVSKVKTWLSYFFIVCTAYQAAAFLTTICAGRRFGHSAKQDAFAASQPALPVVRPPRATCSPSAWAERNWPGLSTWLASVFMACEELTGHPEDDMQDLFAIRFLVPPFLLVCILLPLLTLSVCSGADCPKEEHPDAGVHSDLFLANAIGLGLWCVAFAVSVYGRRARPRFDSLKRTREHLSNRVTLRRER